MTTITHSIYTWSPSVKPLALQKKVLTTSEKSAREESKYSQHVKKAEDKLIMNDLVKKSDRSIISISTVFPWSFFPTTINVEESRITFVFKQFFTSQSHSLDIKDISNIFIEASYFFASIEVVSRTYVQNNIKIDYLSVAQAYKARRIIEV